MTTYSDDSVAFLFHRDLALTTGNLQTNLYLKKDCLRKWKITSIYVTFTKNETCLQI